MQHYERERERGGGEAEGRARISHLRLYMIDVPWSRRRKPPPPILAPAAAAAAAARMHLPLSVIRDVQLGYIYIYTCIYKSPVDETATGSLAHAEKRTLYF